jgi:chemotaxis protein CheC
MEYVGLLSEEQLDFLGEMMSIGAGNAATAFSRILGGEVSMRIPRVHVVPAPKAPGILEEPFLPVASVRMGLVGDVEGDLVFIVPNEDKAKLIRLIERAMQRGAGAGSPNGRLTGSLVFGEGSSALVEVGNILAGVYLTAIHDFCKLNIYHFVPTIAIDVIQSLLDESIAALGLEVQTIIVIENEFIVEDDNIRTLLFVLPRMQSVRVLVDSIEKARMA